MAFQIQIHRTKSIETLNKNQKQNGSKKWNFNEPHNQKKYCVSNKDYDKNCRETKPFCSNIIKQRKMGKNIVKCNLQHGIFVFLNFSNSAGLAKCIH